MLAGVMACRDCDNDSGTGNDDPDVADGSREGSGNYVDQQLLNLSLT